MKLSHEKRVAHGTHIKRVEIDPRLRVRIPTGIQLVDEAVGYGGFVPSSVMMFTGDAGCGKTTLALQIADSLTKQGHLVLFNTGEQAAAMVAITAERMGLSHGFYIGQDQQLDKIFAHLDVLKARAIPGSKTFLIQDSLPTVFDPRGTDSNQWMNGATPQVVAEHFVNHAQRTFDVVIFINHVTKGGQFAGKNKILHTVDSHAHLFFDKDKKSPTFGERLFRVGKNRWGMSGVTSIVSMTEKGLVHKGKITDFNPEEETA